MSEIDDIIIAISNADAIDNDDATLLAGELLRLQSENRALAEKADDLQERLSIQSRQCNQAIDAAKQLAQKLATVEKECQHHREQHDAYAKSLADTEQQLTAVTKELEGIDQCRQWNEGVEHAQRALGEHD